MSAHPQPLLLGPDEVRARCSPARGASAVEQALRDGLDPALDFSRVPVSLEHGQLLLMPSGAHGAFRTPGISHVGVKVAAVAPANPAAGLPRIQATYLLFDAATLLLRAVIDGAALTTIRTPAVSIAAVRNHLLRREGPLSVLVIGNGPQALGHADALQASIGPYRPLDVTFLVRNPRRAAQSVSSTHRVARLGPPAADALLGDADVIVCATSAREPLFDGALVADRAVVVAVGSHEPDAREVDAVLCERATVLVEDTRTALREAGDVVLAIEEGALDRSELVPMRDVITGDAEVPLDRPLLFKSVGMSWEDLVVAATVVDADQVP